MEGRVTLFGELKRNAEASLGSTDAPKEEKETAAVLADLFLKKYYQHQQSIFE